MAERPIVTELRAVDAALAPLGPSRALDERIDALLAGGAPRVARRRVALVALSACAAAAVVALAFTHDAPGAVAAAPQASPVVAPAPSPPSVPLGVLPAPTEAVAVVAPALGGPREPRDQPAQRELALAKPADGALPLAAPTLRPRALAPVAMPAEARVEHARAARDDVRALPGPRDALGTRTLKGGSDADAALEDALVTVRTLKARGDLRGALARVDALLADGVTPRARVALRIERARLLERQGERSAACASLEGLEGDDAAAARARTSCP